MLFAGLIASILKHVQAANKSGNLDLETGKAATVSAGRPDLKQLIARLVADSLDSRRICVVASGKLPFLMR